VRIENNYEIYRRRQAIVEHPYGVIKRQWDFYYIMTKKTIKHASADVGLIFTAYNLRRIFNLIDPNELKQYLKVLTVFFNSIKAYLKAFCHLKLLTNHCQPLFKETFFCTTNQLYLQTHNAV
ncbi:ABC-type arginine transport system ATPase subunit, partial [Flavobacterium sp. CG_9.10]|nr:ABC-type arginine transport system ATPase subunit [Flavobacterium sp. CG_9.10]